MSGLLLAISCDRKELESGSIVYPDPILFKSSFHARNGINLILVLEDVLNYINRTGGHGRQMLWRDAFSLDQKQKIYLFFL